MDGLGIVADFLVDTGIYIILSLIFVGTMQVLGVTDFIKKVSNKIPKNVVEDKFYMYILTVLLATMTQIGVRNLGLAPLIEYIAIAFVIAFGFLLYQLGEEVKEMVE